MLLDSENIPSLAQLYEGLKYWLPLMGLSLGAYKLFDWLKSKVKIADTLHDSVAALDNSVKAQTAQIVGELKELRADMRTFYVPMAISHAAVAQAQPGYAPFPFPARANTGQAGFGTDFPTEETQIIITSGIDNNHNI